MGMAFFCFQENPIKKLPLLRGTKQSQTIQSGPRIGDCFVPRNDAFFTK